MDDLQRDSAVTLLALAACDELSTPCGREVAVHLTEPVAGVTGWVGAEEHLDELVERGLVELVGEDAVRATKQAGVLLVARGWLRDLPGGGHEVTEQGKYWLRRAVDAEDRRSWRARLRGAKASYVADVILRRRVG